MFVTVVRVILDCYFLRFGDRNPGIRIFPLPLPFFPLLPFPPLLFRPPPPIFRSGGPDCFVCNFCSTQTYGRSDGSLDSRSPPSVPSLVTNDWLQQIIPRLSRIPIAQELSTANAQQGLIVVRLHHSVQHQQQRVTDRCLFRNLSHPPCSVTGIRNRFIQSN
jgi:hypothetical protein